jgi:hypothetical protein
MTLSHRIAALAFALPVALHVSAPPLHAQESEVVIEWNAVMQTLHGTGPSPAIRSYPMMHIAIFDAVNSIEHGYSPYHVDVRASGGGSVVAAAAQAAHDVLSALYPAQQARFDELLAKHLDGLPPGVAMQGKAVGHRAARAVLEWRMDDGWPAAIVPDPAYDPPPFPGWWEPTPPAFSAALMTFFPNVAPFGMLTNTQFLPPPPPALTSERYAEDLNEVKALGSATSSIRSEDETLFVRLVAGVNTATGFQHVWNIVTREAVRARGLSLLEAARTFAMMNVAMHDGLQTSFTSKFVYGLWRPVTAIRRADEDLNDATAADPSWTPLLTTPPYPTYAGNQACLAFAAARALELALGTDNVPYSITWVGTGGNPDQTRWYTSFRAFAEQQARSRVLGGIHFEFDTEGSVSSCPRVAEFIHGQYMVPGSRR